MDGHSHASSSTCQLQANHEDGHGESAGRENSVNPTLARDRERILNTTFGWASDANMN